VILRERERKSERERGGGTDAIYLDGFASLRNSQFWLEEPGDKSDGQTDLIGAAERKRIVQNFATG
jgi:hypothetical protein